MFKNLVGFKLNRNVLCETNPYHQYLATLSSNMGARKDAPGFIEFRTCRVTCVNA